MSRRVEGLRGSQLIYLDCVAALPRTTPRLFTQVVCRRFAVRRAGPWKDLRRRAGGGPVESLLGAEPGPGRSHPPTVAGGFSLCLGSNPAARRVYGAPSPPAGSVAERTSAGRSCGLGRRPSAPHIGGRTSADSSPDSVLEAFRRKSGGRSPAPSASPPGAAPAARSCGSSRTEQDCSRGGRSHGQ